MFELVLAVGLALVISGGCSLFEAVLYSVPLRHVEVAAQTGSRGAQRFRALRRDVERPIAAVLSLNTIANTAGAAFAGAAATAVFGHERLGLFSAAFTLAVLVFSEIIPKTAGVVYSRTLMGPVAYPLQVLVWVMTPVIWLTSFITGLIARRRKKDPVTAEELRVMARVSSRTGGIKPYQEETIDRILTLHQKKVRDVMTPRTVVFSLSEQLPLEEAGRVAGSWEHSRVPVYAADREDVVGLVLTKEIFMALGKGEQGARLGDLMRPVRYVMENTALNEVLTQLLERREQLLVVLDEYGGLAGLITLEDILEEILGREIVDESDKVVDKRELARKRHHRVTQPEDN